MRRLIAMAAALALALAAGQAQAAAPRWIGSWVASPQASSPTGKAFNNQTVREVVRLSAGGTRIRIRLTNEYGAKPLTIGAVSVAKAAANGTVDGATIAITFGGKTSAVIPPGAPLVSDPIDLKVDTLSSLSISLYLPGETGPCSCHATGLQTAYVSDAGDFTQGSFVPKETFTARAFLSGVDVETARPAKAILVLGDSISDGYRSTIDGNHRWPDRLAERLAEKYPNQAWGVANLGISGNRILSGGAGEAALTRFDRDVSVAGAAYLIVFEGVNDVGMGARANGGGVPSFEAMQAGYRQIIVRAHARGLKVIGATIAPYEGAAYFSALARRCASRSMPGFAPARPLTE